MKNENASPVPRVTGHFREWFPGGLYALMRRAMHHTRKQFARNQGPSERHAREMKKVAAPSHREIVSRQGTIETG
jgi:hypothetical protein